jgi:hypothetical protein
VPTKDLNMSMSERIDRAFFRSAYDARRILEELPEKTRTTTGRRQLTGRNQSGPPSTLPRGLPGVK